MRYFVLALLALFCGWLLTGVTQVGPGERAVIRRFGRVLDNKPGPGLYVGFPWGIERVDRIQVELEKSIKVGFDPRLAADNSPASAGQMLTGDHNLVNVQLDIRFSVIEEEVVDYVVHTEQVEPLLARVGEAVLTEWVAGRTIDHILGRKEMPGIAYAQQVQERIARYRLGIRIRGAVVTHLTPPDEVKDAFEEVSRAQSKIQTVKDQASQEANSTERETNAEVFRKMSQAKAYATEQLLLARAEAASFKERLGKYRELSKTNPNYLKALWWDEMSRLYARMRQNGRIDLLDNRLSADGLDITQFPLPRKK